MNDHKTALGDALAELQEADANLKKAQRDHNNKYAAFRERLLAYFKSRGLSFGSTVVTVTGTGAEVLVRYGMSEDRIETLTFETLT